MINIRSRASNDVHQTAGVHTALRAQCRRFDAELADRIGEGKWQVGIGHIVVVVAAVQLPACRVAMPPAIETDIAAYEYLLPVKSPPGAAEAPPESVISPVIWRPFSGISVTAV